MVIGSVYDYFTTMKSEPLLFLAMLVHFSFCNLQAQSFKVEADSLYGIRTERETKMRRALSVFEEVMNDSCFWVSMDSMEYVFDLANDTNRHMSTKQINQKLYMGNEWYKKENDSTANVYWVLKERTWHSLAVGYGYPSQKVIHTYSWFLDKSDLASLVGHIAHEWSHKLGFDHQFNPHPGREQTVPYAFGNKVKEFADMRYPANK